MEVEYVVVCNFSLFLNCHCFACLRSGIFSLDHRADSETIKLDLCRGINEVLFSSFSSYTTTTKTVYI